VITPDNLVTGDNNFLEECTHSDHPYF